MAYRRIPPIVIGRGQTKEGNSPIVPSCVREQVTRRRGGIVSRQRLIRFQSKSRGPLSVCFLPPLICARLRLCVYTPPACIHPASGKAISHPHNGVTGRARARVAQYSRRNNKETDARYTLRVCGDTKEITVKN